MTSLDGARVLVTGASRGIGAGAAVRFAAEGAAVAVAARTTDAHPTLPGSLAETADRIRRIGGGAAVLTVDLADADDRATLVERAATALGGPIDVLVNNAAAAIYQPVASFPLRRRRLLFEVNVHAPLDLAQAAAPAMVDAGRGWIVNISSGTARPASTADRATAPDPTLGLYGASKAALERVTQALATELWGTGVRVNALQPRAAVLTEGAEALMGEKLRPEQIEPLEAMVEAIVHLSRCDAEVTGGSYVSLDLLEEAQLQVRALDGSSSSSDRRSTIGDQTT